MKKRELLAEIDRLDGIIDKMEEKVKAKDDALGLVKWDREKLRIEIKALKNEVNALKEENVILQQKLDRMAMIVNGVVNHPVVNS